MGKYFGTDGIRGKAYEQLTFELAFSLGKSLSVLNQSSLVIARDTRESGEMLVDAIIQGAKISGIDVLDLGIQPTPKLAFISKELKSIGVMVTASHNPYQDNGIKVFDAGEKLFLEKEDLVEKAMDDLIAIEKPSRVGSVLPMMNHQLAYASLFQPYLSLTDFKIAIDCANGATFETAENMFSKITNHLSILNNQPDGKNINLNCGSTHLEGLSEFVVKNHLDMGFAFDGDGDRVLMVGSQGEVYDGDLMLYVIASYLKEHHQLLNDSVVLSQMSNLGIIKALNNQGISVIQTPVGDKYILEELKAQNAIIGAENSGHIINYLLLNTGDGVLNACYLVYILNQSKKTMNELCSDIHIFPSKLVNIKGVNKALVSNKEVQDLILSVQSELKNEGFILVRASGTEPLIRVTCSAPTDKQVNEIIDQFVLLINNLNNVGE